MSSDSAPSDIPKSNRHFVKPDEIETLPILPDASGSGTEADTSVDESHSSALYSSSLHSEADEVSPEPSIPRRGSHS